MVKIKAKHPATIIIIFFLLTSIVIAAIMVSTNYKQLAVTLSNGGGSAPSPNYITIGSITTGFIGNAESASYKTMGGFISQAAVISRILPAMDLTKAHVYPNPYKPGSGGKFDADYITFKKLTSRATIRVFNITGELCATINKNDTTVDNYKWNTTNDAGKKLASGVYIYYITNPAGKTAKGKFAIIK